MNEDHAVASAVVATYSLSDVALVDALRELGAGDEHLQSFRGGEATKEMLAAILLAFHRHEQRPKQ